LDYCKSEFGSDTINKLTVLSSNAVLLDTEYETKIKINLKDDVKYQVSFAIEIITERLNNNLTVTSDLIDFTKGDSPVYVEDFQMEDIL
jgi:outer membrane phospholipase A